MLNPAWEFVKIFPPLPLVLSDEGIYHSVKQVDRNCQAVTEDAPQS